MSIGDSTFHRRTGVEIEVPCSVGPFELVL